MKKIHLLIIALGFAITVSAQTANLQWAKNIGGTGGEGSESIAVDASGNVYTVGFLQGSGDFDPGAGTYFLNSGGSADIFVSKLDALGNFVWAKRMGAAGYDVGYSIALDASANVYVTGHFNGTVDFDPGVGTYTLISAGMDDVFVSKLDANGNFAWAKQMGGTAGDIGHSIALDPLGNVYTTGYFNGTADFDPGVGTYTLASAGSGDIFISKLDAAGNFVWSKQLGGTSNDVAYSITVDALQNVYTTGYFFMTADFDPGVGTYTLSVIGSCAFVSKLDALGDFVWADAMNGTSSNGKSIVVDPSQNIYITGYFDGLTDFDPGVGTYTLTPAGQSDIFVSRLDATGNFLWAKQMGSTGYDRAFSIALDATQNVYTTGYFEGTVDFDPGIGTYTLTSMGVQDIFISKLDGFGNLVWVNKIGGSGYDQGNAICVDASQNVFTSGYFSSTVDFDPNIATYTLTSSGSGDVFIQKMSQGTTSINKFLNWDDVINIYPNPTTGILNIELEIGNGDDAKIQIVNSIGQVLINETSNIQHLSFNIQHFPAGIYFLNLKTKNNSVTRKIVKE